MCCCAGCCAGREGRVRFDVDDQSLNRCICRPCTFCLLHWGILNILFFLYFLHHSSVRHDSSSEINVETAIELKNGNSFAKFTFLMLTTSRLVRIYNTIFTHFWAAMFSWPLTGFHHDHWINLKSFKTHSTSPLTSPKFQNSSRRLTDNWQLTEHSFSMRNHSH